MRLLCYNGDDSFSLAEFFKSPNPSMLYSRTWEGKEVTFEDLQNGTGTKKAGYEKIRFCAEQARRDGLQYFGVDTCCIDKSTKVEEDKAYSLLGIFDVQIPLGPLWRGDGVYIQTVRRL